jgi:hypothetical protein
MSNALVIGCGSKFGQVVTNELENHGVKVYGISGTVESDQVLKVDWTTCGITSFEKFLRQLPTLDFVIFNQNSNSLINTYWKLDSVPTLEVWRQSKQWHQSYYVNCVMPTHVLHTLVNAGKIKDQSIVTWMLSRGMLDPQKINNINYYGQKYQNYCNMQHFARNNPQTFIGVCPGSLTSDVYQPKSIELIELLTQSDLESGKLYKL